jgi:hypothetical protein
MFRKVSKENISSIFRVEEQGEEASSKKNTEKQ